jgi:hypothetical protein
MWWKALKLGLVTTGSAAAIGGLVFGSDLSSYVRSSCTSMTSVVRDNIPIDFQLRRARDLLEASGPEMRKNVRLMAEQEVDIASLKTDIIAASQNLDDEKAGLQKLRDSLAHEQNAYTYGDISYTRPQVTAELARRFQSYKAAESALDQKRQLLENRKNSLAAAMVAMETARSQQVTLQSQIEALESRYRLAQATSVGSDVQIDNSRLAQAQKVVTDVGHQLDVSERMLASEARFTHGIDLNVVDEKGLLSDVDAHLSGKHAAAPAETSALSDAGNAVSGN